MNSIAVSKMALHARAFMTHLETSRGQKATPMVRARYCTKHRDPPAAESSSSQSASASSTSPRS